MGICHKQARKRPPACPQCPKPYRALRRVLGCANVSLVRRGRSGAEIFGIGAIFLASLNTIIRVWVIEIGPILEQRLCFRAIWLYIDVLRRRGAPSCGSVSIVASNVCTCKGLEAWRWSQALRLKIWELWALRLSWACSSLRGHAHSRARAAKDTCAAACELPRQPQLQGPGRPQKESQGEP